MSTENKENTESVDKLNLEGDTYKFNKKRLYTDTIKIAESCWDKILSMPPVAVPASSFKPVSLRSDLFSGSYLRPSELAYFKCDKDGGDVASSGINLKVYHAILDKLSVATSSPVVTSPSNKGFNLYKMDKVAGLYLDSITGYEGSIINWIENKKIKELASSTILARAIDYYIQAFKITVCRNSGVDISKDETPADDYAVLVKSIYDIANTAAKLYVDRYAKALPVPDITDKDDLINWALVTAEESMGRLTRARTAFFVDLGAYVLASVNDSSTIQYKLSDIVGTAFWRMFVALKSYKTRDCDAKGTRCTIEGTKGDRWLKERPDKAFTSDSAFTHRENNKFE